MKKRISDNEIDSARKSSKLLFIICFLFLVVTVSLIALYVVYGGELFNDEEVKDVLDYKDKNGKNDKNVSSKVSINVDDNNIVRLFDIVRITNNTCEGYNIQNKILVDDLSDKCRFSLASNIYSNSAKGDMSYTYIEEDIVKNSYNSLFGYGTYKSLETIPYGNSILYYNVSDKRYFTQTELNNVSDPLISYEKILEAYREGDYLYINSVSLYYESINRVFCSDARCEEVIDSVTAEPNYPDYYDLYVDSRGDKLSKYTYKFRLNEAGFYNYVGYEKTQ